MENQCAFVFHPVSGNRVAFYTPPTLSHVICIFLTLKLNFLKRFGPPPLQNKFVHVCIILSDTDGIDHRWLSEADTWGLGRQGGLHGKLILNSVL